MNLSFINKVPLVQTIRRYKLKYLRVDLLAGLTVGIIAFPQAIAFAILSGVDPVWGIYTAIITGIMAAVFGGSEHNVTGPTSAMALVLAGIVAVHGEASAMTLALIMGIYQILFAVFQLGGLVNFVPYPVLAGFSAGVAVIIFVSQLGKLLGLEGSAAHGFFEIIENIYLQIDYIDLVAVTIGLTTILMIAVLKKINKNIPAALIAIVICSFFTYLFELEIETIGSFNAALPLPNLKAFNWELIQELLAPAGALALLASVESISTAAIAEKLTKKKFNSNFELFGQGLANFTISFFKGIPATGSFSRTAANIRTHAKTRFASVFHALVILLIILFLGKYGTYIPFAALAGILIVVAVQMIELKHIRLILRTKRSDALIFLVTFLSTLLVDLITAIEVGVIMAILLIVKQISESDLKLINLHENQKKEDESGHDVELCRQIILLELSHPLFFAAASNFALKLDKILNDEVRVLILRMKNVDYIDLTSITILQEILENIEKKGGNVIFSRMQRKVYNTVKRAGIESLIDEKHYASRTKTAVKMAMEYVDPMTCKNSCNHRIFNECPEILEEEAEIKNEKTTKKSEQQKILPQILPQKKRAKKRKKIKQKPKVNLSRKKKADQKTNTIQPKTAKRLQGKRKKNSNKKKKNLQKKK